MRVPWAFSVALAVFVGTPAPAQDTAPPEIGYVIGVGDVLEVDAFQQDEISGQYPVEENGAITFPLLGAVPVAGKSLSQIAAELESLLEQDYYVDIQLQVEVTEHRSQPVTVLGEVQRPGTYYLKGRTTLTQMLAEAGGLKPTAGPVLELRRTDHAGSPPMQDVQTFATAKLLTGELGGDVELRSGDVLSVTAKRLCFVTGEVARPGQYEISTGLTLMQAISQAGGQGKFASQIVELHRDVGGEKEILTFDLSHIRKGKTPDPPIRAGDVIIVRRRFL
jgi:polysaccharide export outer membrane protein